MEARDALPEDGPDLASFRCARTSERWDVEVEEFVHSALKWLEKDPHRRLKVVIDDGTLVGIVAYEPLEHHDPSRGFFVSFGAIELRYQGDGLGGDVLANLVTELAKEAPGGAIAWRVHPRNGLSLRMCDKLGYEWTSPAEAKPYLEFVASLPYPEQEEAED